MGIRKYFIINDSEYRVQDHTCSIMLPKAGSWYYYLHKHLRSRSMEVRLTDDDDG